MNKVIFDETQCKGCLLCVDACPKKILAPDTTRVNPKGYNPIICNNMAACTACTICARICPDSVITVERSSTPKEAEAGSARCSGGAWGGAPLIERGGDGHESSN